MGEFSSFISSLFPLNVNALFSAVAEAIDWHYAMVELLEKQGVDLRQEMKTRLNDLEEQFKREKEEADRLFEEQRKVSREDDSNGFVRDTP